MNFLAEIKEVKARKVASGDIEYRVVLTTEDDQLLDLGRVPSDSLVEVDITPEGESGD